LYYLYEHPLDLNRCKAKDLHQLHFLSALQVDSILAYRKVKTSFRSIYELQAVSEIDAKAVKLLSNFVVVKPPVEVKVKTLKQQLLLYHHYKFNEMYDNGLASRNSLRYNAKANNLEFGLSTENDAGEDLLDYNSGFLRLFSKNGEIIVGDYEVSFGQGTLINQGFGYGKSSDVLNTYKSLPLIKPHRSTREFQYMRGTALRYRLRNFQLTAFYSSKNIDANVVDTISDELVVSSLQTSGLHVSTSQLANKNSIHENVIGGHLQYQLKSLKIGLYSLHDFIDARLISELDTLPIRWNSSMGLNHSYTKRNVHIFGELANRDQNWTFLQGALLAVSKNLTISSVYRNYSSLFDSRFSNAFSEQSLVGNEKGLYLGFKLKLVRKTTLSVFSDRFSFPERKYLVDAPSSGTDGMLQLEHHPSKKLNFQFRYNWQEKEQNLYDGIGLDDIEVEKSNQYRLQLSYEHLNFRFKNRISLKTVSQSQGSLVFQEIRYKTLESRWSASFRYSVFDTPDYETRIYAFEPDVLYSFSVPAHYGSGHRYLLLFSYKIASSLSTWVRFSQTIYDQHSVVNATESRSDFKIILKYKL
jgi:hypothetical protein